MCLPALLVTLIGSTPQMPLSIAVTDDALAIFANPAGLASNSHSDLFYFYNFHSGNFLSSSSFCANLGSLAAYVEPRPLRWGLAAAGGSDGLAVGIRFSRDSLSSWDAGLMWRPANWLSVGTVWQDVNHGWGVVLAGAAVRPFGNRFTFFGETRLDDPYVPIVGVTAEPFDGITFAARSKLETTPSFAVGMTFTLGRVAVGAFHARQPAGSGGLLRLGAERQRSIISPRPSYLDLRLAQPVQDQKPGFSLMGPATVRTTWQLLDLIHRAEQEPTVRGLLIRLDNVSMSWAHLQELRSALTFFRMKGKRVVVHAHGLGMGSYYLASVADRIVLHPLSEVNIPGFAATSTFLKGALDKLGIRAQATRHGRYKSAVETFTEDSLSPANREQIEELIEDFYRDWITTVSDARNLRPAYVESLIQRGFFLATEAKEAGLVDTACYDDELDSIVRHELRGLHRLAERKFQNRDRWQHDWRRPEATVAIIYANGSIRHGESQTDFLTGEQSVGAATLCRAIREARDNRRVKAVVLRVDSPGGSGFASDLIWRELELCRKKKPVIVSMAGLAASGGYYISCGADRIYAMPGTVTGSIGVFGLDFVTEGLYNRIGIRRQSVKRGEHADMGELRPRTPEEDSMVQAVVDHFYEQFVRKVAAGRNLTYEHVDSVGQGRIWTGRAALAAGLVDSLGGLRQVFEYAKRRARVDRCDPVFYPRTKSGLRSLLRDRISEFLWALRFWEP